VVNSRVGGECERVAGLHVHRRGVCARFTTCIADQVLGGQRGYGGVVVCVHPDVLVHLELCGPDRELLEDVVGRRFCHRQSENGKKTRGMHVALQCVCS
jgi:hypothetical protein